MLIFSKGKPKIFNHIEEVPVKNAGKVTKVQQRLKDSSFRRNRTKKVGRNQARRAGWGYVTGIEVKSAYKHPAVFPEALAKDHIISWSDKGDLVFDPFMGSGTTAVAALDVDRKYIGAEIAKEYVEIANERIKNHTTQTDIF